MLLPRESLEDKQANCIDGAVLFATLLEAASLNPALVIVPGHAFVAWETWSGSNVWNYLETTMIGTHSFQEAHSIPRVTRSFINLLPTAVMRPPSAVGLYANCGRHATSHRCSNRRSEVGQEPSRCRMQAAPATHELP